MDPATRGRRATRGRQPTPQEMYYVHRYLRDLEAAASPEPEENSGKRRYRGFTSYHDWFIELSEHIPKHPAVLESVLASAMWSTFVCTVASTTFAHLGLFFVRSAQHPIFAFVAAFGWTAPILGSMPLGTLIGIYWHDQYQTMIRSKYTFGEGAGRSMIAWMTILSVYAGLVALVLGAGILRLSGESAAEEVGTADVVMLALSGMGPVVYVVWCCFGMLLWYKLIFG
ncbi:hypothetical protein VTO73DRAFT_9090 [Trametes versicolor]